MYNSIGKRVPRVDGYEKVTGKAVYGDDLKFHGMLYAGCRYTDIPVGKITNIDVSRAEQMEGVEAIALHKDVPGRQRIGPIRADQYPLVKDEVFYSGDVVAVVAAATQELARAAAEAILIEYEPLEGIFDVEEALKPDARLVHPEFKSNLVVHYPLRKGDVAQGFSSSDHVIERTYRTGFHEHAYIEPESVTAVPDPVSGGFDIYGSIQNPYTTRKVAAAFMGLLLNQINVKASTLGGSFGGKDDIINVMACRAALLAQLTGKPVKLTYTREESIQEGYKRHPYIMTYKVGFNADGRLQAMKIDILADSGAYSSQTFFVTWRSVVQATGPYEIPHVQTDIRGVYTNNTYTAAFRGFGSPQVIFAQESLMDEIAEICGISPLEIRRINGYQQGSVTASGQTLNAHQVSLKQVIAEAVEQSGYEQKREQYARMNSDRERFRYGIGLSCSFRGCSLGAEGTDFSSAIVAVQADGSVYVLTGLNENGQGMRTTFCQIASEVLGVALEKIVFLAPQTAAIADGGPTVASRGTLVGGRATIEAANTVKKRLFSVIRDELQVTTLEETEWKNGLIARKQALPGVEPIPFEKAAEKAYWAGMNLSAYGWFKGPDVGWNEKTGQGNAYFTYVYGCQIADVKVDTHTGKIEALNITAAHDVGRVINRTGAEGQVCGGVAQGLGYGMLENYNIESGEVKSVNFDTYLIPTINDIPPIQPVLVENPDPAGPFGAKSLGEPTLELTAAALNNAVSFALGTRSYQIPLTLEQVFLGKPLKKPSRQSEIARCGIQGGTFGGDKQAKRLSSIRTATPRSLQQALELLASDHAYTILSGGTDVIVQARLDPETKHLLNISGLSELKEIHETDEAIHIGGAVSFSAILSNKAIQPYFPLLVEACSRIGSTQIRNRGTIGGNLVNAAPCADSMPPLIVYNASIHLQSQQGERIVPAAEFIIRHYQSVIRPDEILTAITLPKRPLTARCYTSYFQLGRRNAMNITRLSISALVVFAQEGQIQECALVDGAMFSRSQHLTGVEEYLKGKRLTEAAIAGIHDPLAAMIDAEIGKRWSAAYKKPVFIHLCQDALRDIQEQTL